VNAVIGIKFVLVALVLALLVWSFRNRDRAGIRASGRVAIFLLAVIAIASVLDPNITSEAAKLLGVTRGTDLVLYLLVMAFAFTSTGLYFRSKNLEAKLGAVVRQVAINEAVNSQGEPGSAG
jgi:hypothetical protein